MPTDYGFTGMKEPVGTGLVYLHARYYAPWSGRFVSADTIVPEPGNPQAFNRYAYALNNPLRYADPSGYDPIDQVWEEEFYRIHERWPTDEDRRDRFFSLLFLGSGKGGAWTDEDWTYYSAHRDELWKGKLPWQKHEPASLYRFHVHLDRLASYYNPGEEERFVQAVGFIFGGLALGDPIPVLLKEATRPDKGQYQGLFEGTAGWRSELVEGRNPSHHWAGLFYAGFYLGRGQGRAVNEIRDWDNPPDLKLGELAVDFGDALYRGYLEMRDVGRFATYTLADPDVLK
jgi:RHS repeat-associated protein